MSDRLRALLAHPRLPLAAALVALVLTAPALLGGWHGDDWVHRAILLGVGEGAGRPPLWDLFRFVQPGRVRAGLDAVGILPWWTAPDLQVGFLRPVSVLTHLLDTALWPQLAWLQHLHGLLWYAAGVGLVGLLLRAVVPDRTAAGLGTLFFAVEDAHAIPAAWIANRNALVTLVLGVGLLLAHIRWRRTGRAGWGLLALGLLPVALLSGESAVGAVAYIVAWQLTLDGGGWGRRLAGAAPAVLGVVAWRLVYDRLDYGAHGSGMYLDPGADPLAFAGALVQRWPTLMLAQWLQVPIDLWAGLPTAGRLALTGAGVVVVGVMAALLAPLVRARPEARFLALGAALALVGPCAAFPMDRLLIFGGIGCLGLLGMAVAELPEAGPRRLALGALGLVHGPLAALMLLLRSASLPLVGALFFGAAERTAPVDADVPHQTFVFVNGTVFAAAYTGVIREVRGDPTRPAPARVAVLSSQLAPVEVRREGPDTLVLTRPDGFLAYPIEELMRAAALPFTTGQVVETPDFDAEIREVLPDGRARTVAFHFRAPLEAPRYRWLAADPGGTRPWTPPAAGEVTTLEPVLPAL